MKRLALAVLALAWFAHADIEKEYDRLAKKIVKRDAFPVLFDPKLTPAAEAKDLKDDDPVIGVFIDGDAQAFPVPIMGIHELANIVCGGKPLAVSW